MKKYLLLIALLLTNVAQADTIPEDLGYQDGVSSSLAMPLMNEGGSIAKARTTGESTGGLKKRSKEDVLPSSPDSNVDVRNGGKEGPSSKILSASDKVENENGSDDGFAPLDIGNEPQRIPKERFVTLGVPLENAHTLKVRKGLAHFTRARSLLIAAVREFDTAVRIVDPSVVLDPIDWRLQVLQQAKDIEVILSPEARRDDHSVAIKSMSNGLISGPSR